MPTSFDESQSIGSIFKVEEPKSRIDILERRLHNYQYFAGLTVKGLKGPKMTPPTASAQNHQNWHISIPTPWSAVPDMMSLATSGWRLSKLKGRTKMPNPTDSLLYSSWIAWAKITKVYRPSDANLPYICTGYDVISYFRSEATAKQSSKMSPQMASGGISRERFKRGSPNFTQKLSRTTSPKNLPDTTSLVTSGRVQNPIKYCTKVMRKTRPVSQRVKYFGHCLSQIRHMSCGHPRWASLRSHRIWRHQLLPVGIYRSSQNGRKFRLRRLCVEF